MAKTLFFDLDGTLTDPKTGITASIQYAMSKLGLEAPDQEDLTWCIGPPLRSSFTQLVGAHQSEQAVVYYRERFARQGWRENRVYPGIIEMLSTLKNANHRLYVATSKPHVYARKIIDYFELEPYFEALFGPELDGTRGDKTELLRFALSHIKSSNKAVMIGDRKHDMNGALSNDIDAVGVTYGYGTADELLAAGARTLVDCPADLITALL